MSDQRHIVNGWEIPTETYSDQPYIVKTADGAWLCVVTTGAGVEGATGQHVVVRSSTDQGRNWSTPVDVEPADGPEASYAVLLRVPEGYPNAGRVFCFYNHNSDNVREVISDPCTWIPSGICKRVDSLGHFVMKLSDDSGRSWSAERYDLPMRTMEIDRQNVYGGRLKFFWNVGKPFIHAGAAFVSVHKVGGFGEGFFTRSEGVLLKSPSLLTERDPARITWETLPDGDYGLRPPPSGGPIAEEQSYAVLSDGSFYSVYRTIDGHPACTTSRDGGHSWAVPHYQSYADGRPMKHPRAANFVWKCANGRYLYWFHNHGGRFILEHPQRRTMAYEDRNPAWLCGGVEVDTPEGKTIVWSQPEIVLYDDDVFVRMSYPDLIEDGGKIYLSETQKNMARVHEIDSSLLEGLWGQFEAAEATTEGLVLDYNAPESGGGAPAKVAAPPLPAFLERDATRADLGTRDLRAGFTVELWVRLASLGAGQVLLDTRTEAGKGLCLETTARGTLEIALNDGRTESRWECDPGALTAGGEHHVGIIVDGGPKIITFIVDGKLHDGGSFRQFGWGRFSPALRDAQGSPVLRIDAQVLRLQVFDRALRTSEVIADWRAGRWRA